MRGGGWLLQPGLSRTRLRQQTLATPRSEQGLSFPERRTALVGITTHLSLAQLLVLPTVTGRVVLALAR